jgi:hypothetical protein
VLSVFILQTKPEYIKIFTPDFKYSQNGSTPINTAELIQRGSYNVLINDSSYTSQEFSFEASHDAFKEVRCWGGVGWGLRGQGKAGEG